MATFKCEVRRHQQRADGTYNVKLRITHHRQSRWLPTSLTATRDDLTTRGNRIRTQALLDKCDDLLRQVRRAVETLSHWALEEMDVEDIAAWVRKELGRDGWRLDFFEWGRHCMEEMTPGARGNYRNALNALARYYGSATRDINDIRAADIRAFGDWLDAEPKQAGNGKAGQHRGTDKVKIAGGVSTRYVASLARLHALARRRYNDPDAERQRIPRNPFDGYAPKRVVRARGGQTNLGVELIQRMIDARPAVAGQRRALAITLLSFCLMGANIADMYAAPPVTGEWWTYRRKKVVGKKGAAAEIRVRVPECAGPLLAELRDPTGRRWLDLGAKDANGVTKAVNRGLRAWQTANGVRDFTFYAARHSWGTIACSADVGDDRAAVDAALGHNADMDMADIYIEKDWRALNAINTRVLALFDWSKSR